MLWPVTSLKRPRCPKRLRSKIGSNRSPRYLGASDTFSLLSPWILLYLHRERGRKICRRSFRSPLFISILYCGGGGEGNRFGRSYGLSGSYSLPYSLCARGNRKMEETNLEGLESNPKTQSSGRRKSEFITGGKVTSRSGGIHELAEMRKNDNKVGYRLLSINSIRAVRSENKLVRKKRSDA